MGAAGVGILLAKRGVSAQVQIARLSVIYDGNTILPEIWGSDNAYFKYYHLRCAHKTAPDTWTLSPMLCERISKHGSMENEIIREIESRLRIYSL